MGVIGMTSKYNINYLHNFEAELDGSLAFDIKILMGSLAVSYLGLSLDSILNDVREQW